MNFNLTEEQRAFQDGVRTFARRELEQGALLRAHAGEFPRDIALKMARAGLLGITLPEADGGMGGTLMDAVLAIEQVALVCPRSADVVQEGNFGAIRVLAAFGSDDQKRRYLSKVLSGEEIIAVGMTEPNAGSATTDLETSATPDGAGFRINGQKVFPNPHADRGFPAPDETTVAKLMCNQSGFNVANEAMQIMGGLGYTQETLVEYCMRRSRGWMIAGGSIEMMKNRLAETIFERRFSQRAPRASPS